MSNAPYLLPKAREGYRLGHAQVIDSMINDGLWDAYKNVHMGDCAELCAKEKGITRADQDAFAAESYRRALRAQAEGKFKRRDRPGRDRRSARARPPSSPTTRSRGAATSRSWARCGRRSRRTARSPPATRRRSTTARRRWCSTAADAAAARGWKPLARIVARGGPRAGARVVHDRARGRDRAACSRARGWKKDDVDLWEINEAFAVVSIANNQLLGLDPARVNVWGGAVALGHPIGASGARVLVTLLRGAARRGQAARRRLAVHRRRRGHRARGRDGVKPRVRYHVRARPRSPRRHHPHRRRRRRPDGPRHRAARGVARLRGHAGGRAARHRRARARPPSASSWRSWSTRRS